MNYKTHPLVIALQRLLGTTIREKDFAKILSAAVNASHSVLASPRRDEGLDDLASMFRDWRGLHPEEPGYFTKLDAIDIKIKELLKTELATTVKVRLYVAVGADGQWNGFGFSGFDDQTSLDTALEGLGAPDPTEIHLVVLELPIPKIKEVEVEEVKFVQRADSED